MRSKKRSRDLGDAERACRERLQDFLGGHICVEPARPVFAPEHDDLAIVIVLHVIAGRGRHHGEGFAHVFGAVIFGASP